MTKPNKISIDSNKINELELLASIARNADNSILLIQQNGEIIWANNGFEKLHSRKPSTLKTTHPELLSIILRVTETDSSFFKKNASLSYTRLLTTPNGEKKWIQATISPTVHNHKNQFIVIETDITKQKEVEEELIQRQENAITLTEHLETVRESVEEEVEELNKQKNALKLAKEKSEEVLNKVLPYEVAIQLKKKGYAAPRHYKKVTILSLNIRNFYNLSSILPIEQLIAQMHENLIKFDTILEKHYVEKIKTVGGNYLAAGGVPLRNRSNPIDVVLSALEINNELKIINIDRGKKNWPLFDFNIGIHTGKVIAGVVGKNKLTYDVWGDTVSIASAIEQENEAKQIIISETTKIDTEEYFIIQKTTTLTLSSTEEVQQFKITRLKPEYSADENGIFPNQKFMQLISKI